VSHADEPNPYAPPRSDSYGGSRRGNDSGYQLMGDVLIAEKGVELPDLCIFSGEATEGARVRRKLQWAPPWLAILVAISPLIYVIVYYIVRETGELGYALSPAARARRTSGIAMAIGGSVGGFGAFFWAATEGEIGIMVIGLVVFFVGLIAGALRASLFRIVKIDKTHIHLKLRPAAVRALGS
jgi:hypothetical protein